MKKVLLILISMATILSIAGCASRLTGESFSREEARKPQQVQFATVEHVRDVIIEGTKTNIGSGAGAIVGGIAGSTIGDGRGSRVAAVLGSVAGGLVGAAAEEGLTRQQGVEVTVRFSDGKTIAIVQEAVAEETFSVGDKVRVLKLQGVTRVTH